MRVRLIAVTASVLVAAGLSACGPAREGSASSKELVAKAMLKEAQAGRFQPPPSGDHYQGPVDCRVDKPRGFHGRAVYLCKIGILIPTVTGPFDPPF